MRKYMPIPLVYLLLLIPVLGLFTACSETSETKLLTYKNEQFGYSIDYPQDWRVEVADEGKTCLLSPTEPESTGSIRIDVIPSVPAQQAAQSWEIAMATQWEELTRYDNRKLEGQWDWYLSYGWVTDQGFEFLGQAFFKYTPKYLYKVDTAAKPLEYDKYPFDTIISSFKLL